MTGKVKEVEEKLSTAESATATSKEEIGKKDHMINEVCYVNLCFLQLYMPPAYHPSYVLNFSFVSGSQNTLLFLPKFVS